MEIFNEHLTDAQLDDLEKVIDQSTAGEWSWEPSYQIGKTRIGPTVYADRTPSLHGMNLFGRMDVDANGENNLNAVCKLHNLAKRLIAAARERNRLHRENLNLWIQRKKLGMDLSRLSGEYPPVHDTELDELIHRVYQDDADGKPQ